MRTPTDHRKPGSTEDGQPDAPSIRLEARRERRVPWIVVGVLVVVGSGLAFAFWASQVGDRHEALALARDVEAGESLEDADLDVVRVGSDDRLALVPPARRDALVGRVAAGSLDKGTLVAEGLLVDDAGLGAEHALVGVTVDRGELPLGDLRAGSTVLVVKTPGTDLTEGVGSEAQPAIWLAEIFSVAAVEDPSGLPAVSASLKVKTRDAPAVASAAAQGRIRLALVRGAADVPGDLLFSDLLATERPPGTADEESSAIDGEEASP